MTLNSLSEIANSASDRAHHISQSIAWYSKALRSNEEFRQVFTTLVGSLAESETTLNGSAPHARRQIHFVAVGKSGGVAQLAANMFVSVGVLARYLHPGEAFHGDLGAVCENDTVVCISNQGSTSEILQLLPKLRERLCRIFAITSRPDSPLAKGCDYTLPLAPFDEACPLQQAPITSTVSSLALCQLLVAASIEHREFAISLYARNHPGGSIGKRIYVKVSDVMVNQSELPLAQKSNTFTECVSMLTKHAMSVLLVEDKQKLAGIISEKDIRVAMEKFGPQAFNTVASELMNPSPITIEGDMLAIDALKLMKDRLRPLNFLPIVDSQRNIVGLLRLHDLVNAGIVS